MSHDPHSAIHRVYTIDFIAVSVGMQIHVIREYMKWIVNFIHIIIHECSNLMDSKILKMCPFTFYLYLCVVNTHAVHK